MIHYQVRCSRGHEFDGWFKDSASFDRLGRRGLVECPFCGDTKVARALMAPAVAKRKAGSTPPEAPAPAPAPVSVPAVAARAEPMVGGRMPAHLRALLQQMRGEIERNCDYVGPQFADEARKMHRGESDRRGIYGEATRQESEALADEGIDIASIPWVPLSDG